MLNKKIKFDFLVLGADGIQGRIVSRHLLELGYNIFLSDFYKTQLSEIIKNYSQKTAFEFVDLRDIKKIIQLIKKAKADVVINCAEMDWNVNVYKACLKTKKHCVDLGSWIEMTQEQLAMNGKFKKIDKTAIAGCGSVPGIGNVMLNYASKKFDRLTGVDVGFAWTSNKKKFVVPFSMPSILEEFTNNPRIVKNGKYVEKNPFEISFRRNFRAIGPQKVFIVDHPEVYTFFHYFKKKGMKNVRFFAGFPNHSLNKIFALIDLGFHSEKLIRIENIKISPIELLSPVLKELYIPKGYTETENLWVHVRGVKDKKPRRILMECIVPPIAGWENAGCNIDTGFPAVIMAQMIKDGRIKKRGSFAPEAVVPEGEFFRQLRARGFTIYENGKPVK